jgi:ribose transport system substrate-binding protein
VNKILTALTVTPVLMLLSCGQSPHTEAEKYYLVVPNAKSQYWVQVEKGLNQAARDLKVHVSLQGGDTYDVAAQKAEFRRVRSLQPAGILVSVGDPKLLGSEIDGAIAAGIPVVTIDSDAASSKRLTFVGTNNHEAGRMAGMEMAKYLKGKGNVMIFLTAGQANQEERLQGYRDAFSGFPGIHILTTVDLKGDPRVAFDKANEVLNKPNPTVDAFGSLEGLSAKEVVEVLKRHKTKKVLIAMDALDATLEGVDGGYIDATIAQKPYTMGYFGLRLLADIVLNKLPSLTMDFAANPNSRLPRFVDTGVSVVDKSNLAEYKAAAAPAK